MCLGDIGRTQIFCFSCSKLYIGVVNKGFLFLGSTVETWYKYSKVVNDLYSRLVL